MKILLTRHGQTDWNVLRKVQGRTDIELNETGIKQAEIAREKLLNYNIDLIISSPLKRAKKTAEIIENNRNIPIVINEALIERSFGRYEGKAPEGIEFDELWNYKLNKKYNDAENIEELFARVNNFLDDIQKKYQDKTVLLVTHGGVTVPIRVYFEGIPEGMEILKGLGIENCEILEYEV